MAFVQTAAGDAILTDYLEQVKEITTGDRRIITATAENLISQLIDFVPSTASHARILAFKGDSRFVTAEKGLSTRSYDLIVPDIAEQVRFFFSFPSAGPNHKVHITLSREGRTVADSDDPRSGGAVHDALWRRDGALAFQSFRFIGKDAAGPWNIELTDASRAGAAHLPDTDLLVDIRSAAELEVALQGSAPLTAGRPLTFAFTMFGRRGDQEYTLPVTRAEAFAIGRAPVELRHFSMRLHNFEASGPSLLCHWQEGFPESGQYRFKGTAYYETQPKSVELQAEFDLLFDVAPAMAIDAWFGPTGRPYSLFARNPDLRFSLPPVGEQFQVEFDGIQIETRDERTIQSLSLTLDPFSHSESGSILSPDWVALQPARIRSLPANRPTQVQLRIRMPEAVPPEVADGVYRSVLYLKNGIQVLDQVPLLLSVSIPRFVADRQSANTPFGGEEKEPPLAAETVIRYPGAMPHPFELPLWSTSLPGTAAKAYFRIEKALEYKPGNRVFADEGVGRIEHVTFQTQDGTYAVPGKNTPSPGVVQAAVILDDPSLNGRSFENSIVIQADHHRRRTAKLIAHVRFIPPWQIYLAGAILMAGGAGLGLFWYTGWWRMRPWFGGRRHDVLPEVIRHSRRLDFGRETLGHLTFTKNPGRLEFETRVPFQHNPQEDDEAFLSTNDSVELSEGDQLVLSARGGRKVILAIEDVGDDGYGIQRDGERADTLGAVSAGAGHDRFGGNFADSVDQALFAAAVIPHLSMLLKGEAEHGK